MANTKVQLIPKAHLREIFEYRDGALFWKNNPDKGNRWNAQHAGNKVGWLGPLGYTEVCLVPTVRNGLTKIRNISLHRLIFCFHHGYYPPQVDHISGDRTDNRIENLRAALSHQNCANRRIQRTNTTGVPGVRLHKDGHYEVRVQFAGKRHQVGSFKTLEEARIAHLTASKTIRGEWQRGEASHY